MTTRRPLKDGQYSNNNNDTANLGVPSFAQSVQPYQSEEDSSYPLDRAFTDDSIFSDDSQQQQQGVVMSSNTQDSSNSQDATSPGYTGSSTSKSVRYKSAMTTRARQRRMRRIKERGTVDDTPPSTATANINSSNSTDPPGRVSPSAAIGVPPPSPSLATTIDSAAVAKAKEHVEQMRLRNSPGGTPTTPTTNLNSSGVGSGVEMGKGGHSPLQSRVYEKHRSRSRSASRKNKSSAPQGEMSSPPLPFPSSGSGNVEKSMLVQTASAQVKAKMTPEQMASQILAAKKAAANKSMLSRDSSGGSADPSIPAVARGSHHTRSNTDLTSNTTHSSRRKKETALQAPKPEDYIPDWKTTGSLNPQEVRDAANFTSVQFQCSNVSGEVEMFSDDGEGSDYFSGGEEGDSIFDNEGAGRGEKGVISPTIWETMANPKHATEIENRNREVTSLSRWQNEVWSSNNNGAHSDATTPSILHSDEIFHQKAAASIVSLLSAERMSGAGLMAPDIGSKEEDEKDVDVEGDSPQGVLDSPTKQHFTFDSDTPGSSRGGEWKGMTQINRTLFRDDLDDDVKQSMIFQAFRQNMIQPSDQLTDLLSQIHRKGNSIDRAFATRRKNACGALKILSAKDENRINLCWTVGVLPAIGSVLSDVNVDIQDDISRAANTEARNRIVSTLLNLSVNKKNRMLIVNTPGVLESVIQTILYDGGEGRQGCCTVLLYLAKTTETRKMIVKSAGMLECLSKVIEVPPEPVAPPKIMGKKGQISPKGQDGLQRKRLDSPDDEDALEGMDTFGLKSQKKKSSSQHDSPGKYSISEESDASSHTGSHSDDGDDSQSVESNEEGKQLEVSFESEASPMNDGVDEKTAEDRYDADPNRFLHGARLSVFACLLCLVKSQECAVSCILS